MNVNYKRNWVLFLLPSSRIAFGKHEEIQLGSLFVIIPILQSCISTELCSLVLMGDMLVTLNSKNENMGVNIKLVDGYITLK